LFLNISKIFLKLFLNFLTLLLKFLRDPKVFHQCSESIFTSNENIYM